MGATAIKELRSIDRKVRAERTGKKPLKTKDEVKSKTAWSGQRLPIEPYRAWVRDLLFHEGAQVGDASQKLVQTRVAETLGYPQRRLYAWLKEVKDVDYLTVDRAASAHGGTTPEQIYWNYGPKMTIYGGFVTYWWEPEEREEQEERERREAPPVPTCHRQRCEEPVDAGGRFCVDCTIDYARIRAELEGKADSFRRTIKRKGATPTCCNPACRMPRIKAERYCDDCQREGWSEDNLE